MDTVLPPSRDLRLVPPSVPSDTAAVRARLDSLRAPAHAASVPAPLPPPRRPKAPRAPRSRVPEIPAPAPLAPPRRSFDLLHLLTLTVAVVLAAIAAYFSVSGMTRIFPGAEIPVIIMASTMEAGKLAGAAWLSRNWTVMNLLLRPLLMGLIICLAVINALGVFGQLSAAHLDPHVTAASTISSQAVVLDTQIEARQRAIAELSHRVEALDAAMTATLKRGPLASAVVLVRDQRSERADLVRDRTEQERALLDLKESRSHVSGAEQRAAADVGVLEYAATLFGVSRDLIMQLLILAMVLSCDPMSLTLVWATASQRRSRVA